MTPAKSDSLTKSSRVKVTMELEMFKIFMNDMGKAWSSEVIELAFRQTYLDLTVLKLMEQINCCIWMKQRG